MKVNFTKNENCAEIGRIPVGEVFLTNRKSVKEKGLYMRIDHKSGLFLGNRQSNGCYAVNLETGQLREFTLEALVERVKAEVSFK